MKLLSACVVSAGLAWAACAQSVPTPGAPSVPLTSTAAASLGAHGVTYQYGIEFVTVTPLGPGGSPTAPYSLEAPGNANGSVDHAFRIGRYEVTSGQWGAFFVAAEQVRINTGQAIPFIALPTYIGGTGQDLNAPAGGITWRTAAIFANWLHNDMAVTRAAFMDGAYDVSTFGYQTGPIFTDQTAHHPDARFWVPTMNELLTAHHYDPNRYGAGQGGYWGYNITQDTRPVYGPPGITIDGQPTQANSNWSPLDYPGQGFPHGFGVTLGSYPNSQSPWGLLDAAGGAAEWTESVYLGQYRYLHGSAAQAGAFISDFVGGYTADLPSIGHFQWGFRIAAAVPSPGAAAALGLLGLMNGRRKRA